MRARFAFSIFVSCVAACDCVGESEGLSEGDAAIADAIVLPLEDAAIEDFGVGDVGVDDLGVDDSGVAPCEPMLEVDPPDVLPFPIDRPRLQTVSLSAGDCPVVIARIEITGPVNDPAHPSVNDFTLLGSPSFTIQNGSVDLSIAYSNDDISSIDFAELHIYSNDPEDPEHIVVLNADDIPCASPIPSINVLTANPVAGQPVSLEATSTTTISLYQWSFIAVPSAEPSFTAQAARTSFTPLESGPHTVGVQLTNRCGAEGPLATETFIVN